VPSFQLSRRSLLVASAGALGCGRQKAIGFRGYCFVANQESRSVTVIDLNRFRVRKQIPLDAAPSAVLAHPSNGKVFVLAPDAGTVYEIDGPSLAITRRAHAGNQASDMLLSSGADALWVLYRDPASLVELPLDSFRPNRRVRLPAPGTAVRLSRDNQAAIVSPDGGNIVLASLTRGAIDRTIDTTAEPSLLAYRWDGKQVLVGSTPDRSVTIYDVPTGRVVVRLPLPLEPRNFCSSADDGQLFVSGDGLDAVVIVFPSSTELDQTILAGHAPGAMAVTHSRTSLYLLVTNPESGKVMIFDISTRGLVAAVQVGRGPRSIHVTPDDEYALVLNYDSGDVAVIRTRSITAPGAATNRLYRPAPLFDLIPVGQKPVSAAILAFA